MNKDDLLALNLEQVKGLTESIELARKVQQMVETDYWKILEEKIKNLVLDKKEKWLSGSYSDKTAIIMRRKAMGMKEVLNVVKGDIGRGRMAAEMLKQRAKIYSEQGEQG